MLPNTIKKQLPLHHKFTHFLKIFHIPPWERQLKFTSPSFKKRGEGEGEVEGGSELC